MDLGVEERRLFLQQLPHVLGVLERYMQCPGKNLCSRVYIVEESAHLSIPR